LKTLKARKSGKREGLPSFSKTYLEKKGRGIEDRLAQEKRRKTGSEGSREKCLAARGKKQGEEGSAGPSF